MATKRTRAGFTLLEMIIYVAILAFMLAVVIQVVVSVARSTRLVASATIVENSASQSLERITREVRGASGIRVASSTLNTHPGRLVLDAKDDAGLARTVEFLLVNNRLQLKENGVVTGYLTATGTTVTNLVFRRFATSTIEGVKADLTLTAGTSTSYKSESFSASALER